MRLRTQRRPFSDPGAVFSDGCFPPCGWRRRIRWMDDHRGTSWLEASARSLGLRRGRDGARRKRLKLWPLLAACWLQNYPINGAGRCPIRLGDSRPWSTHLRTAVVVWDEGIARRSRQPAAMQFERCEMKQADHGRARIARTRSRAAAAADARQTRQGLKRLPRYYVGT